MQSKYLTYIPLSDEFTFDKFIVEESNREAYNLARRMADMKNIEMDGSLLFLSGEDYGVGKSHLLQAVGNSVRNDYPQKKVQFWTCETFVRNLYNAYRKEEQELFHAACQELDVLLFDGNYFDALNDICRQELMLIMTTMTARGKRVVVADMSASWRNDLREWMPSYCKKLKSSYKALRYVKLF